MEIANGRIELSDELDHDGEMELFMEGAQPAESLNLWIDADEARAIVKHIERVFDI